MMDRRRFLLTSLAGSLAAPLIAEAQQAGRVYRVGAMALEATPELVEATRQGLRDLGWIEGQNIVIEYRYTQGREELFPVFAAEFVRLKVDVIVAVTDTAVHATKQATSTIPIVMAAVLDPEASGFVAPLGHPGGTSQDCRCLESIWRQNSLSCCGRQFLGSVAYQCSPLRAP
jgi:ABC-type uncharacterized transport system substrate-binding protein